MDNQNTSNPNPLFDLAIDEKVKQSMRGAAVVGGIAAILSIVNTGLNVVSYFTVSLKAPKIRQMEGFDNSYTTGYMTGNILALAIGVLISILMFYYLYKFSSRTKSGIDGSTTSQITEGLSGLASYFRLISVLIIIVLVLCVIIYSAFIFGNSI